MTSRLCGACGVDIAHKRRDARYCGRTCKWRASNRRRDGSPTVDPAQRQPLRRDGACAHCGASLSGMNAQSTYCSSSCRYKARYQRKRSTIKARALERYWENRDREVERSKRYRANNPERRRQWGDTRSERMRSNPGYVHFGESEWLRLVNRHGGRCAYCDVRCEVLEMDHVIPIARGGRHAIANILPTCPSCNRRKSSSLLVEWRYRQRG